MKSITIIITTNEHTASARNIAFQKNNRLSGWALDELCSAPAALARLLRMWVRIVQAQSATVQRNAIPKRTIATACAVMMGTARH